ncbi:hypothetical protein EDB19DRAFT_2042534 [Suillus lakei]|nr:hypothetical protein EDB19DRAFT_2042534 [Suillus lakei]
MDWTGPQLDRFDRYVMNNILIRLIRLSDMKFVGRGEVRNHFWGSVTGSGNTHDIIKYTILSHRWLHNEEPTYKEMKQGTARGPGYEKLETVLRKGQGSSSTELDESIRSMFRWYKDSAICIVHPAQSGTIEDMMEDPQTERGWTLQELLAPLKIKFFNKHWMSMTDDQNDKAPRMKPDRSSHLLRVLEEATGIPRDAARRQTTRVEDTSYSLMGIFDVSLQIAYGEGGDRAFCRLIETIIQARDPSVHNWEGRRGVAPQWFSCYPSTTIEFHARG